MEKVKYYFKNIYSAGVLIQKTLQLSNKDI